LKKTCPLLKKPCIEGKCMLWKELVFENTAKEPEVLWDCSLNWNMLLQLENAKQLRGASASMDKVATEINAGAGSILLRAMGAGGQRRLK